MASLNNKKIKIHEKCNVAPPPPPPPSGTGSQTCIPLTFFDLPWLRFHPVEQVFFYTLHNPKSHPSIFFHKAVPKLKASLSHTLQHFLPLAGKIVWPPESQKPVVQYTPGVDVGLSLVVAESDADFNHVLDDSPHEASLSRCLVPHLESTHSSASVVSLQITLFPNNGFSIGVSTHHAVMDGKSSTLFMKAWASLCKTGGGEESSSPSLVPELEPLFNREIIDKREREIIEGQNGLGIVTSTNGSSKERRSLEILPFKPRVEDSVRGTFQLTREDLEKIKKRVLSTWDVLDEPRSKPQTLSSFVLTCAHVLVCVAKAIQGVERERDKFAFVFPVDCRARLEPPIPDNYIGNCVWDHIADTKPMDFIKEDGLFLVAKAIHEKIQMLGKKGVLLEGAKDVPMFSRLKALSSEGIEIMGVACSNRFGVYGTDFGWGRPAKVETVSVDRGLSIGLAESKDGRGGVEVGLVLSYHVMNLFTTLFREGL